MKHVLFRLVALAGLTLLAGGCAVSSYTTAETLPRGRSQFWVAPQLMRIGVASAPVAMPFVELGTRYGLTDDVELGLRLGAGAQADAKIALRRPAPGRSLTISVAPGIGYIGNFSGTPTGADGDDLHFVGATLPAYLSWKTSDSVQVTFGPRVTWLMQYVETSTAGTTHTLAWGASLGVLWQISDGFAIAPEVAFATPWLRALTGAGAVVGTGDQRALQIGIGLIFGGGARTGGVAPRGDQG